MSDATVVSHDRGGWLPAAGRADGGRRRAHQNGDTAVQRLQLEDVTTGERAALEVAGVFPYLGLTPNTQFLHGLVPLNAQGQIVTDLWMRTTIPGILAAGDIRADSARQLISAAGGGATAALAAIRYLRTGQWLGKS
jgi:thioredoxin reductase (NADPH)